MSYLYVFLTIILTVYGQFIIKWQVSKAGDLPLPFLDKCWFLFSLLFNVWIISAFCAAFLAAMTWMAAMTKLPLGYAYPFVSISFVLIVLLSSVFFNETLTPLKLIGVTLILLGVAIGSRG